MFDVGTEALQRFGDVRGHTECHRAVGSIEANLYAEVFAAFLIDCDRVQGAERGQKMISIFLLLVFDGEVINHEGEGDGSRLMKIQAGNSRADVIAVGGKVSLQTLLREEARLW